MSQQAIAAALKKVIPEPTAVLREALIVLGGVTIAAWVISRYPSWQQSIQDASITVKDSKGEVLW